MVVGMWVCGSLLDDQEGIPAGLICLGNWLEKYSLMMIDE